MFTLSSLQEAHAERARRRARPRDWLAQLSQVALRGACFSCQAPLSHRRLAPSPQLCPRCQTLCLDWRLRGVSGAQEPPWILSLARYHGPLYERLISAKRGDEAHIHQLCSLITLAPPPLSAARASAPQGGALTLTPIPPRASRLRLAGSSLPYELAQRLSSVSPRRLRLAPRGLLRAAHSPSQSQLSGQRRSQAQVGTLVGHAELSGQVVCLIDDVCTTGATLREARRACLAAGALHVEALCLFSAQ